MNSLLKAALVLLILFSVGLFALVILRTDGVAAARVAVEAVSGWLLVFRILVVALLWWFWDTIMEWLFSDKHPSPQRKAAIAVYKAQRTKFVLGFIIIELIVVQNVIGAVFSGVL